MTRQKTFKSQVRGRMAKTGERYTSARRQLAEQSHRAEQTIAEPAPESPAPSAPDAEMLQSEETIRRGTGRGWDEWFAILDDWGAAQHSHTEIARWLVAEYDISGWWSQSVTVSYERARGLRAKHQVNKGFTVSVNRTVGVPAEHLSAAFTDAGLREQWLPDAQLRERTSRPGKSARFDWLQDGSVVVVGFERKGDAKTQVGLAHEKLPDAATAERMKAFWRERLTTLKEVMEARSM